MLIESILGYKGSFRVLSFLAQTPNKPISRSDIKKYTYLGNEAVNSSINRLTLANILIKEKKGKKNYYYFNLENQLSKEILNFFKLENKKVRFLDYKTKIILNEFLRKTLEQVTKINKISIFGSYAKGTQTKNSDIDIALIIEEKNMKNELIITNITQNIYKQFNIKIETHFILKKDYKKTNSILIQEIKNDEIILINSN